MTNKMCLPGATFIFKKPTDSVIKKHSLKVIINKSKKRRSMWEPLNRNSIVVNDMVYAMDFFNCKVMYFGPDYAKKTSPVMEGARYIIFDKLRVTNKANIAHLVGKIVNLPYILLSPQQRIIDVTKLPSVVQYNVIKSMVTEEVLPGSKYAPIEDPAEFIRFIRKNASSRPTEATHQHFMEALLIKMVSSNVSRYQNIRCDLGTLQCGCGYCFTINTVLQNIKTRKTKRSKYSFHTLTCPRCRINYKLATTPEGKPIFRAKKKGEERILVTRFRHPINMF